MTREEAIRILDPETTGEALAEIEYYNGFSGKTAAVQAVSDACILAVAALREQEERRWIPVTERLPEDPLQTVLVTNGKETCVAVYSVVYDEFGVMCGRGQDKRFGVTHWMPLPEPPKEAF